MAGRLPFALGLRGGGGGLPPWMRHAHRRFTSQRRFSSASENAGQSSSPKNPIRGALSKYNALNESYPTVTKVGTTVAIVAFGDTMAQRIQHNAVAPNHSCVGTLGTRVRPPPLPRGHRRAPRVDGDAR